jgi:hypothetical protein
MDKRQMTPKLPATRRTLPARSQTPPSPSPPSPAAAGRVLLAEMVTEAAKAFAAVDRAPHTTYATTGKLDFLLDVRAEQFPHVAAVQEVVGMLQAMPSKTPRFGAIEPEELTALFTFLFNSALKAQRRNDEQVEGALADMLDLFNPEYIGLDSRLFPTVPRHRLTVALAVKHIKDRDDWLPTSKRVVEALGNVVETVVRRRQKAEWFLANAHDVDVAIFRLDRAAWEAGYTSHATYHAMVMLLDEKRDPPDYQAALDSLFDRFCDDWGRPRPAPLMIDPPKQTPLPLDRDEARERVAVRRQTSSDDDA